MLILQLAASALWPIFMTLFFFLLGKKEIFQKLSYWKKQILIGVAYGFLACLATQFGIPFGNDFILNARNASPIIAGLIFGAPAGIIAGTLGAVYRIISMIWGIGKYTWIACSVSTFLSGWIAAGCHIFIFERKRPEWYHGLFIGISSEVTHMLLVILTHMNDEQKAYEIINQCSIPMVVVNSVSIALSLLLLTILNKENLFPRKKDQKLSSILSLGLYIIMIFAYTLTSIFTDSMQTRICMKNANDLLTRGIIDTKNDILDLSEQYYLNIKEDLENLFDEKSDFWTIKKADDPNLRILQRKLQTLSFAMRVKDLYLLNQNEEIILETSPVNRNALVFSELNKKLQQGVKFAYSLHDEFEEGSIGYIAFFVENRGYVIASYTKEDFDQVVHKGTINMAEKRHAGKTGYTFLLDKVTKLPISFPEEMVDIDDLVIVSSKMETEDESVLFKAKSASKEEYACMYSTIQNYIIFSAIPMKEVMYHRDFTLYLTSFLLHETFSILFVAVFELIKRNVVNDLCLVNRELSKIRNGELQTRVHVYSSQEFCELSDDINDTVIVLNRYIDEANARIDAELKYARTIQSSLIPSKFPAFPDRKEIDISAKIKPAREVGGDFYDFCFLNDHTLMFTIADVSGKGIPAAMFMMRVRTLIKSYTESEMDPEKVLTLTNNKLVHNNEAEMFVTLWMGYLDLCTGTLTYVNGGHNPPILIRKGEKPQYLRMRSGLVLGGMSDIPYRKNELTLKEGDQLFLYTDGVTEAFNSEGEQYGEERLLEILDLVKNENAEKICERVQQHMNEFIQNAAQFDDITMLNIQYLHQISSKEE